jgi:hypothetical protein
MSNDVHYVLPVLIATLTAKRFADYLTDGFYNAQLRLRSVPFLKAGHLSVSSQSLTRADAPNHKRVDVLKAKELMAAPAVCVHFQPALADVADVCDPTPPS